ncbi:hypothetical protein BDR06DRAFT_1060391 [Suillus hirtellus]|nr:hypothetical protein BDR06DRAFT_1060391 [Suillus hirtellus]
MKSATVEQSAPNKPPKLLAGELTPEAACDWDNACSTYFMHKEVDVTNQVKMIAFSMMDPRLHTWYLMQKATLDAGTFMDYMTALKDAWLETHWDLKLRKKVLGSQQGNRSFYKWALELQNLNALLYGNTTHLSDEQLCNQLEANMNDELTTPVLRAKLGMTLTLKKWIEEVKQLNDKCLKELASHRKIAEEMFRTSKRTQQMSKTPQYRPQTSSSSVCLGPLTQAECTLLNEHNGCYKCRKFHVTHRSKECLDGPPDALSYKTLTEADANATKPKTNKPARAVAAIAPIRAVMPSSVIEDGSDSDDDTCVAPF